MYDFEANWQPIETAPKDGTRVLGWDGESGWYSCEFEKLEGAWVAVPFSISGWDPHHEWQTDSLAAVDTGNAQLEGDDVTPAASTPTVRIGNYCQISRKSVAITGTQEVVDKAGRKSEIAYQIAKRGKELKRDMEAILTQNQGQNAGNTTTARTTRSLESWTGH